jgi:hypothetical protein
LNDICDAGVRPAVQDLKDSLRGLGIRCAAKDYVKTLFFSSVPTAATMFLGLSAPVALAAGAGISLVASLVNYREDRNDTLRRNPYSYLLAVEGEFRSKRK